MSSQWSSSSVLQVMTGMYFVSLAAFNGDGEKVVIAVLWVFIGVAIFNVRSCPPNRKSCKYLGKTIKHRSLAYTTSQPCDVYECYDGKLSSYSRQCSFQDKCYDVGYILEVKNFKFKCEIGKENEIDFKPLKDVEVEKFYEEIEQAKGYLKSKDIIVIMGDFNAKVGDERVEDVVGPSGIGNVNERGSRLIGWCQVN
ncbi:craniofacial development protein 2-like [Plakobranchus ocellatus]|uniref:Craniofacial development protein 2-like n=1 Tax=Plakobranchus ocellatus TaxID=259542 RepID=A0AAV4AGJ5_9GAST|nr:craniofacial development protein 2-like [Plakobranchus ocellatus]